MLAPEGILSKRLSMYQICLEYRSWIKRHSGKSLCILKGLEILSHLTYKDIIFIVDSLLVISITQGTTISRNYNLSHIILRCMHILNHFSYRTFKHGAGYLDNKFFNIFQGLLLTMFHDDSRMSFCPIWLPQWLSSIP